MLGRKRISLAGGYLLLAVLVTLPSRGLLGNPDIDVWNHVWGYWWFAHALSAGQLPWHTHLLGAPGGGTLYFVDPLGAIAALPLTMVGGPALAYNVVLVARVALAGVAAHVACEELFGEGPHAWVAGVAYAASPFLLCELANGISEVTAVWYLPAALWTAARALRLNRTSDWVWVGVCGGMTTLANFYYGLTAAFLVGPYLLWYRGVVPGRSFVRGAAVAAVVAGLIAAPGLLAMHASVLAADPLVLRSASRNMQLARHNAVDPRVYFMPGHFASVDLQALYGEPFRHTGYLRLSILFLAGVAGLRNGVRTRGLFVCGALALMLGLGPYLWWDGEWVKVGNNLLSLPFRWCQQLVPALAITHPLRLSLGAQAVFCVLAGGAMAGRARRLIALAVLVPLAETAFASNATWPLPTSSVEVPRLYTTIAADPDRRAVLDLPAEVGTSMATSRYFFFQTVHGHPVPYKPDARAGSTGDPETFAIFPHPMRHPGGGDSFALIHRLTQTDLAHLVSVYGWIIVHTDLSERVDATGLFEMMIEPELGAPTRDGYLHYWRLPAAGSGKEGERSADGP